MGSRSTAQQLRNARKFCFHFASRGVVIEQVRRFSRDSLPCHLILHQLRYDRASGNQVDHRIERDVHQQLSDGPAEAGDPVKGHHRGAEQGGFNGDCAAGGESDIAVSHGVPGFAFDHANRVFRRAAVRKTPHRRCSKLEAGTSMRALWTEFERPRQAWEGAAGLPPACCRAVPQLKDGRGGGCVSGKTHLSIRPGARAEQGDVRCRLPGRDCVRKTPVRRERCRAAGR